MRDQFCLLFFISEMILKSQRRNPEASFRDLHRSKYQSSLNITVPRLNSVSTCCDTSWWCLWSVSCRLDSKRWTSSWAWGRRCSTDTCVRRCRWPSPLRSRSRWSTRRNPAPGPMGTWATWRGWRASWGWFLHREWKQNVGLRDGDSDNSARISALTNRQKALKLIPAFTGNQQIQ